MTENSKLYQAMINAHVQCSEGFAEEAAISYFERLATVKRWGNSQSVSGDIHMQFGIKMNIELLKKKSQEYGDYRATCHLKAGMDEAIRLTEQQLKEFPWYCNVPDS